MHRPPAVSWDVELARWQGHISAAIALCSTLVWAGFLMLQGWCTSSISLLLVLLASILLAVLAGRRMPVGKLRWDGDQWHWSSAEVDVVHSIVCVLDLQFLLLLRIHCGQGARHWLWLEAGTQPARWQALRRAVVAFSTSSRSAPEPKQPV
jgi:toxin CptA